MRCREGVSRVLALLREIGKVLPGPVRLLKNQTQRQRRNAKRAAALNCYKGETSIIKVEVSSALVKCRVGGCCFES